MFCVHFIVINVVKLNKNDNVNEDYQSSGEKKNETKIDWKWKIHTPKKNSMMKKEFLGDRIEMQ